MERPSITRFFRKLSASLQARWLRRSIDTALALNRTEVRPDGLCSEGRDFRLGITWRARNVHPWESELAADRKARRLVEQTFSDTHAALERLFIALPEVDVIDLRVLEADTTKHGIVMTGSISRREFETCRVTSIAMRLRLLGVNYNLVNSRLEPLAPSRPERDEISSSGISARPPDESFASAGHSGGLKKDPPQAWHQGKPGPH